MRSAALGESLFVVAAAAFGIVASQSWPHDRPDRCPQPSAASVEMLFAPCLASMPTLSPDLLKLEFAPPGAAMPSPAPWVREPALSHEGQGRDVDVTSSIRAR